MTFSIFFRLYFEDDQKKSKIFFSLGKIHGLWKKQNQKKHICKAQSKSPTKNMPKKTEENRFLVQEQCVHCNRIFRKWQNTPSNAILETRCRDCWQDVYLDNQQFYRRYCPTRWQRN